MQQGYIFINEKFGRMKTNTHFVFTAKKERRRSRNKESYTFDGIREKKHVNTANKQDHDFTGESLLRSNFFIQTV